MPISTIVFKTHYSGEGRSIIQVDEKVSKKPDQPSQNIVDLCLRYDIKDCVVIDDSISGFLALDDALKANSINFYFGLRISFVNDVLDKSEESNKSEHKNILLLKSSEGYKDLIKISSIASTDYFYNYPRLDYPTIRPYLDKSFQLAIPFYDSFLFRNKFSFNTCIPNFNGHKPIFFLEDHNLIYDQTLRKSVIDFAKENNYLTQEVRSVYYAKRSDFLAWQGRKVLNSHSKRRSGITNPELPHCSSDTFCLDVTA